MFVLGSPRPGEAIVENFTAVDREQSALHTQPEVTMEKIFRVDRTAPSVIHSQVSVFAPRITGGCIHTGEAEVKFIVGIPLRAFRSHLRGILVRICFSSSPSRGSQ